MIALGKVPLLVLATVFLSSAALAAPIGTPDPVADCLNNANIQYQIDYAQCIGLYPPEATALRAQCQTQATMKYTSALAACSSKSSSARTSVINTLKQNTDSGFVRRLRH